MIGDSSVTSEDGEQEHSTDQPDWRSVASFLAWSHTGQPHSPDQQAALDRYDKAVMREQTNAQRGTSHADD